MFAKSLLAGRLAKIFLGLLGFFLAISLLSFEIPPLQAKALPDSDPEDGSDVDLVDLSIPPQPEAASVEDSTSSTPISTADIGWAFTYGFWQGGISLVSNWEEASPAHGRVDVIANAGLIRAHAPRMLEIIVAAAIAHQASDIKDRPFGVDAVEEFWIDHIDSDASVGIAQLRPDEVEEWMPALTNCDLLDPQNAVMVMTAKLMAADQYTRDTYGDMLPTDRYMLLALVQNTSTQEMMVQTIDHFALDAHYDWVAMLDTELGAERDWREQLRLVLLQVDWLVEQGWETPWDLDVDYWRIIAFGN